MYGVLFGCMTRMTLTMRGMTVRENYAKCIALATKFVLSVDVTIWMSPDELNF